MNAFYEHHQHNIAFHYRCFDRMLNAAIQPFSNQTRDGFLLGLPAAIPRQPATVVPNSLSISGGGRALIQVLNGLSSTTETFELPCMRAGRTGLSCFPQHPE